MFKKSQFRLALIFGAVLMFSAPVAQADDDRRGSRGRSSAGRGYYSGSDRGFYKGGNRGYNSRNRYVAPYRAGRFYPGRGYFYGGGFWARPYFGIGAGIPFGYGYNTNRGCGYVNEWGDFYPAPCYR